MIRFKPFQIKPCQSKRKPNLMQRRRVSTRGQTLHVRMKDFDDAEISGIYLRDDNCIVVRRDGNEQAYNREVIKAHTHPILIDSKISFRILVLIIVALVYGITMLTYCLKAGTTRTHSDT
jgi:hypothetical protein